MYTSPEQRNLMKADMREAVREEFKSLMTEENAQMFWLAGFALLQEKAEAHAGRFVIGSMSSVVRKVSMFVLLGGLVYAVGGWSALAGLFKSLFSSGAP